MKRLLCALSISAAYACTSGDPAAPHAASGTVDPPTVIPPAPAPVAPQANTLRNVADLFETRVLPTCSLNGGVCHNSKNYPDLRDLGAIEDLVGQPCGMNVDHDFPDACEPHGDRLVADGIDVEIVRVVFDAATSTATVTTDADVKTFARVSIHRPLAVGSWTLDVTSAIFEHVADKTVRVRLDAATDEVKTFFQPQLPLREDNVWPSDVNGNGISGASLGWREIVPGKPERSWIVARLWDEDANPELMPRQCREWNDEATRALGCWIQGLRGDLTNFYDDIDWKACTFDLPRAGRCGTGATVASIVDADCAGCHGADQPPEGLDLRSAGLRAATAGVRSHERPDLALVEPGNPNASWLFLKVTQDGIGDRMPKDAPHLSNAKIETLRAWITAGAP